MRPLTDSERAAMYNAWNGHFTWEPELAYYDSLEAGFIAALDHSDARIAALQAENTQLRARCERLREALKPFAEYAANLTNWDSDPVVVAKWSGIIVTTGDFRQAAAALKEGSDG